MPLPELEYGAPMIRSVFEAQQIFLRQLVSEQLSLSRSAAHLLRPHVEIPLHTEIPDPIQVQLMSFEQPNLLDLVDRGKQWTFPVPKDRAEVNLGGLEDSARSFAPSVPQRLAVLVHEPLAVNRKAVELLQTAVASPSSGSLDINIFGKQPHPILTCMPPPNIALAAIPLESEPEQEPSEVTYEVPRDDFVVTADIQAQINRSLTAWKTCKTENYVAQVELPDPAPQPLLTQDNINLFSPMPLLELEPSPEPPALPTLHELAQETMGESDLIRPPSLPDTPPLVDTLKAAYGTRREMLAKVHEKYIDTRDLSKRLVWRLFKPDLERPDLSEQVDGQPEQYLNRPSSAIAQIDIPPMAAAVSELSISMIESVAAAGSPTLPPVAALDAYPSPKDTIQRSQHSGKRARSSSPLPLRQLSKASVEADSSTSMDSLLPSYSNKILAGAPDQQLSNKRARHESLEDELVRKSPGPIDEWRERQKVLIGELLNRPTTRSTGCCVINSTALKRTRLLGELRKAFPKLERHERDYDPLAVADLTPSSFSGVLFADKLEKSACARLACIVHKYMDLLIVLDIPDDVPRILHIFGRLRHKGQTLQIVTTADAAIRLSAVCHFVASALGRDERRIELPEEETAKEKFLVLTPFFNPVSAARALDALDGRLCDLPTMPLDHLRAWYGGQYAPGWVDEQYAYWHFDWQSGEQSTVQASAQTDPQSGIAHDDGVVYRRMYTHVAVQPPGRPDSPELDYAAESPLREHDA
ncbi:hypothetical protein PYCC9005_005500 [Savitreella phatthalungensis]